MAHKLKLKFIVTSLAFALIISYVYGFMHEKGSDTYVKVKKESLIAEAFVKNYLYESNGLIRTNLLDENDVYLSESIGLWMEYLVQKNDYEEFNNQVDVLKDHFIKESNLVPWRIKGNVSAQANALIDDLRIITSLFRAGELWNKKEYTNLALEMSKQVVQFNQVEGIFINHVDINNQYKGDFLTLSYLIPSAFDYLVEYELITNEQYEMNRQILTEAPVSETGFFPKTYEPFTQTYQFDEEVNLIDQYYVGYHLALWGGDVSPLIDFTRETLAKYDGKLYGRFSNESKLPIVDYEGTSVYALAILMCIELEEVELAKQLFTRMKEFQIHDEENQYFGGYIDEFSLDTHSFDNLLPLLAERSGIDEGIFK